MKEDKDKTGTGVDRITERGNLLTADGRRIAQPGNTLPMRHGAYMPRVVDPLAREMLESILGQEQIHYLEDPTYSHALWAWGRAEARVQVLQEWIDKHGLLDSHGRPTPAAGELARAETAAEKARQRLGLDPLSRAQLGKHTTSMRLDLARLWEHEDAKDEEQE